ncbi:MAG: hypothetical protein QMC65_07490 [Candidatus Poseidoniaceae archaeon]
MAQQIGTESVSRWEDLPPGQWLEADGTNVDWYLDENLRFWRSSDDGYRVWTRGRGYKNNQFPSSMQKQPEYQPQRIAMNDKRSSFDYDDSDYDDDDDDFEDSSGFTLDRGILPWIGVGMILISIFLNYISILGFGVTGLEFIETITEFIDYAIENVGGGDSGGFEDGGGEGESVELSFFEMLILVAGILFVLSPISFLVSAILSSILLFFGKSTRLIAILHFLYVLIIIIPAALASVGLGVSVFSFIGNGFYMGAAACILLFFKKPDDDY